LDIDLFYFIYLYSTRVCALIHVGAAQASIPKASSDIFTICFVGKYAAENGSAFGAMHQAGMSVSQDQQVERVFLLRKHGGVSPRRGFLDSGGCRALGKCFIYSRSCGCSYDCEHLYRRHRVRTSALTPHIHACRRQRHVCQRCSYSREDTTPTDGELSMIPPSDHACASRCLAGLCMSAEFVCC
jgi:hypothetical protein